MLYGAGDPFLADWDLDLTTRKARQQHGERIDLEKQNEIEERVSAYIQNDFLLLLLQGRIRQRGWSWNQR